MAKQYTYTNSPDYITRLAFDYLETYSFQRGVEFEDDRKRLQKEYDALQSGDEKRNVLLSGHERYSKFSYGNYLVNDFGRIHPLAVKTHTFKKSARELVQLVSILGIDAINVPYWMCAPIYRDAIVFYDNSGVIVSSLHICFSCQYMSTKMFSEINADIKVYTQLKQFFIELGHKIEYE